jgi:hypothetical protein
MVRHLVPSAPTRRNSHGFDNQIDAAELASHLHQLPIGEQKMNSDHKKASDQLKAFTILKKLSLAACGVAIGLSAVLLALGNSKANDCMGGAAIMFIMAFIFSNAAGYHFNLLSIIDLQKRVSALQSGSPNDSKSDS